MAELSDIITSKVRVKVLELMLSNPLEMYHIRAVVREVKEEINAVRRELLRLETLGILKREARANRIYFSVRDDYPFYVDMLSLVAKSVGIGRELIANRKRLGKISFVLFSGGFVRRKPRRRDDDVDILFVGDIVLPELAGMIRKEESKRGSEINYTVMSRDELDFRKKRRDPFLQGILLASRVMIIGDEYDLVT